MTKSQGAAPAAVLPLRCSGQRPSVGMAPFHEASWSSESKAIVDLDGTITVDDPAVSYAQKPMDGAMAAALTAAADFGLRIVVSTARNMRTHKGGVDSLLQITAPIACEWLVRNGVRADDLLVGKPWCGPGGFYIDDRNLHPEEFVFRFLCPLADSLPILVGDSALRGSGGSVTILSRIFRRPPVVVSPRVNGGRGSATRPGDLERGEWHKSDGGISTEEVRLALGSSRMALVLRDEPGAARGLASALLAAFEAERIPPEIFAAGLRVVAFDRSGKADPIGAFVPAEVITTLLVDCGSQFILDAALAAVSGLSTEIGFVRPPLPALEARGGVVVGGLEI